MLQGEHSAICLSFIELLFVIEIYVLSIFEWQFYTNFTEAVEGTFIALCHLLKETPKDGSTG